MHTYSYSISSIGEILASEDAILRQPEAQITTLAFDSRKLVGPDRVLFFALQGSRDGHVFLEEAYGEGVRSFVVRKGAVDAQLFPDANLLFVSDTLLAMQTLATYHRSRFDIPVIGITGSNGKTIVKEWLYQLLSPDFKIHRSPRSYNSQIGVAISLWQLETSHELALIEVGISQPGEMERLHQMVRPTMGVLTNIGPAHDSGFSSKREKIEEKWKLFDGVGQVVYSPDKVGGAVLHNGKTFTWGKMGAVDLAVESYLKSGEQSTEIRAIYQQNNVSMIVPFTDAASLENAITCWSVMLALGYAHETIATRMLSLLPVGMRLELKKGINNSTVIDDSYSNDIASLTIALDFLKQQNQHGKQTLVLSDFPGIKVSDRDFYNRLLVLLKESGIKRLVTVGPNLAVYQPHFSFLDHLVFQDTEALLKALSGLQFRDETILIKGARSFRFERISRFLTEKQHDTVLEVDLQALETNLKSYKSKLPRGIKLMAMVKAFSYGSGSFEIANVLQFNQVDYLTVAYLDEGVQLRKAGITLPIVVMSPDVYGFESLVNYRLEPEIFSFAVLEAFVAYLEDHEVSGFPIHIKFDTGMHRLGFAPHEAQRLADYLTGITQIRVDSVFSHLVAADASIQDDFTRQQIHEFEKATGVLANALPYPFLKHIANTAAIDRWPEAYFDMVRLGIGLYGIGKANESLPLEQVGTLKTTVSQIRQVPKGDSVGYGRHFVLDSDRTIATVKVGYADGYDRRFGNGVGKMRIRGKTVPTIGHICMDMCMLDVTGLDVAEGDEVTVFGDVAAMAADIGTIPYEILAGISQRVKRIYFYE